MLVSYPDEWDKYFIPHSNLTFRKDTPPEIIEEAKRTNKGVFEDSGKYLFHFEGEENNV